MRKVALALVLFASTALAQEWQPVGKSRWETTISISGRDDGTSDIRSNSIPSGSLWNNANFFAMALYNETHDWVYTSLDVVSEGSMIEGSQDGRTRDDWQLGTPKPAMRLNSRMPRGHGQSGEHISRWSWSIPRGGGEPRIVKWVEIELEAGFNPMHDWLTARYSVETGADEPHELALDMTQRDRLGVTWEFVSEPVTYVAVHAVTPVYNREREGENPPNRQPVNWTNQTMLAWATNMGDRGGPVPMVVDWAASNLRIEVNGYEDFFGLGTHVMVTMATETGDNFGFALEVITE